MNTLETWAVVLFVGWVIGGSIGRFFVVGWIDTDYLCWLVGII